MRRTLIAVGLTVLLAGGCGPTKPTKDYPWSVETETKYNQLKDGMTAEQVALVMGSEGTVSAADAYGVPQFHEAAKEKGEKIDEVREWNMGDGSFIRVAYREKKVASYSLTLH